MTLPVTDVRSNPQDQIYHAVKVLGRPSDRLKVFVDLHRGRQKIKTATEIANATRLKRKRVLEVGKNLADNQIVRQTVRAGEIAYEREGFYYATKKKILALVNNPNKLKNFPTKYSPKIGVGRISITVPRQLVRTSTITIDEIDSFAKVQGISDTPEKVGMLERQFKEGIQKLLEEPGQFKDWGGESSDLYTTRLKIKGTRYHAAIAFKGRGLTGVLTPARMGKNGDQIQRLFTEDAQVFLVQYNGRIASSVVQQMATFAQTKSHSTGKNIFYGIIDGKDSARLVVGYTDAFNFEENVTPDRITGKIGVEK